VSTAPDSKPWVAALLSRISRWGTAAGHLAVVAAAATPLLLLLQLPLHLVNAMPEPARRMLVALPHFADPAITLGALAPGQPLRCFVLACDSERRHVDLGLAAPPADAGGPPALGASLPGRVAKVVPGVGLYVQLPQHRSGRVALTGAFPFPSPSLSPLPSRAALTSRAPPQI